MKSLNSHPAFKTKSLLLASSPVFSDLKIVARDPIPANLEATAGDSKPRDGGRGQQAASRKKEWRQVHQHRQGVSVIVYLARGYPFFSRAATTFGVRIRNYWSEFSFFMPKDKVGSGFTKLLMMLLLKNSTIGSTK